MGTSTTEPLKARTYSYELVSFKVEDTFYRVPRHGFTEFSDVFETMFSLPQPGGSGELEGQSDDNPIVLPSCSKLDFESLLEILYPVAAPLQLAPLRKEQWLGVLKLSSLWSMDKIRQLAIDELCNFKIDSIERVVLGKTYRIRSWLVAGYMKIIENWAEHYWTLDKLGSTLGWETTARIMGVVLRGKENPKPIQSSMKVGTKCTQCRSAVSVALPNPVQRTVEISCEPCQRTLVRLVASTKADPPNSAAGLLRGEALSKAVEAAFKEELACMD